MCGLNLPISRCLTAWDCALITTTYYNNHRQDSDALAPTIYDVECGRYVQMMDDMVAAVARWEQAGRTLLPCCVKNLGQSAVTAVLLHQGSTER
jgi:hypothetical protein